MPRLTRRGAYLGHTFTWDKARAEQLAEEWRYVAPVKLGGVAYGDTSLEFIPGRYVLIGGAKDTIEKAEMRLRSMVGLGFTPFAMLWRPSKPAEMRLAPGPEWKRLHREWSRPAIIHGDLNTHPGLFD